MKPLHYLSTSVGLIGGMLAQLVGGWDQAMTTLVLFMVIDYITGLIVAGAGKSTKTKSGSLNSHIGFIGLSKKLLVMLYVIIATRLDMLLGLTFCRDAIII